MPTLNYTTTVSTEKTVGEIQRLLARGGARRVLIEYDDHGNPAEIAFQLVTGAGERGFKLPARIDNVWRVLTKEYNEGRVQRRFTSKEQAGRVAWRIIKDWLEAQLALIEANQATLEEVMLPYLQLDNGQSLYEEMVERQLALPPSIRALPPGR